MKTLLITLASLLLLSTSPARADFEFWQKGPCAADFKKFCQDITPGEGSVLECFKAHDHELSPDCKAKREERMKARQSMDAGTAPLAGAPPLVAAKKDCAEDIEKLCKIPKAEDGVMGGSAPVARGCLRDNMDKLSPACKAQMNRGAEKREEMRKKIKAKKPVEGASLESPRPNGRVSGTLLESFFGFEDEIQHDDPATKKALLKAQKEAGVVVDEESMTE